MGSPENPNWVFDYGLIADIPVPGVDLPSLGLRNFSSPSHHPLTAPASNLSIRSISHNSSGSKACREKMRRDRLNDRFMELGSILDPGRPPKMDKAVILNDAVRMVSQLQEEAQKLKESNENLQEKINELKAEKNELRDEKQRLKVEKDNLEQQVNALSSQPGFLPRPPTIAVPFPAPGQVVGGKLVPFMGYSGVPMWQFLTPAAVDTSQDHVYRPPVA